MLAFLPSLTSLMLAITWPPRARKFNKEHQEAAQVYGIVSRFPACTAKAGC